MKRINWKLSPEDAAHVLCIAARAAELGRRDGITASDLQQQIEMDIACVHLNICPLRLREMADGRDFDLSHDVFGIRQHLDRKAVKLGEHFEPRFARK